MKEKKDSNDLKEIQKDGESWNDMNKRIAKARNGKQLKVSNL